MKQTISATIPPPISHQLMPPSPPPHAPTALLRLMSINRLSAKGHSMPISNRWVVTTTREFVPAEIAIVPHASVQQSRFRSVSMEHDADSSLLSTYEGGMGILITG